MKEIIIVTQGFVFLGEVSTTSEDGTSYLVITDAKNIRNYGTSKGLGQIALEGPQAETVLDECGTILIPLSALVGRIKCVA